MRLLDNAVRNGLIIGMAIGLAACGRGGAEPLSLESTRAATPQSATLGPAADYPQIIGEPYSVGGKLYTPADVLSYDSVGYAVTDQTAGSGVQVAHKTLPYPSYVEVTSLETGTTILARVTSRGPMTSDHMVALSREAAAQLGAGENEAVRVRRVNPPEHERAELRAGSRVAQRLEVPKALVSVLREKLPASGSASLRSPAADAARMASAKEQPSPTPVAIAPSAAAKPPAGADQPEALASSFDRAFSPAARQDANRSYPLPPLTLTAAPAVTSAPTPVAMPQRPVVVARQDAELANFDLAASRTPTATTSPLQGGAGETQAASQGFVIQAAAFSNKGNAERAASSLDGFVRKAGRYYRVRTGPYATRGQAEAALAKVRAAGYSDARVFTAG
ncbi:SPOR domain-containing protein [Altererythrobacter sp. MTPC7]|uniref:SPOR domain-containing protein n=1 Tax=Altererythrobacter sp. MTPC7 TaxID=3056567 RepID=UPI0036F2FAAA